MLEFKDRLRELMNEKGINTPEDLSPKLPIFIHPNTIRNYLKGKSPKDFEKYEILASFFGVTTDYLQGYSNAKTIDINIKNICNKYGLNEISLSALELINRRNIDFNFQEINTINYLLEDIMINKQNSIVKAITDYLFFDSNSKTKIKIQTRINGTNENIRTSTDLLLDLVFFEDIKSKLNFLKTEIKKEGENNEYKRKRKE